MLNSIAFYKTEQKNTTKNLYQVKRYICKFYLGILNLLLIQILADLHKKNYTVIFLE